MILRMDVVESKVALEDNDEIEHDEWLDLESLSARTRGTLPVEVPVGNDVDGDLEMELGKGTNPDEVQKIELNLLENFFSDV